MSAIIRTLSFAQLPPPSPRSPPWWHPLLPPAPSPLRPSAPLSGGCHSPCLGQTCGDFYKVTSCAGLSALHSVEYDCYCVSCCRSVAPPPPPPLACHTACGQATCGEMRRTATCATLHLFGCDCQGCCSDIISDPPPPAPAPTATSTARPLSHEPVSSSMGEWLPPNGVGGGRRSSKQGACAGSYVTRKLVWRRPEKDFAAAAAAAVASAHTTCFDASSAAACATSAAARWSATPTQATRSYSQQNGV